MSIELTPGQADALTHEQLPVRVVGPKQTYVLISEETYERIKSVLDLDEPTEAEETARIRHFGKLAGWDDPGMNLYEDFRPQS